MSKLKSIGPALDEIPQEGHMLVPGLLIATEPLLQEIEIERPIEQIKNVATLKGIVGYSIAMPDIHWGYGFPIGGVAAMDARDGVVSPGGVGFDINCGVRLAIAPVEYRSLSRSQTEQLIQSIYHNVPSGVGKGHQEKKGLSESDYKALVTKGARWSVEQGYGFEEDLSHIESYGLIEGADLNAVSHYAKERGSHQLGTVGSGNHFVEIGEVGNLYLPNIAHAWGIEKGMTYLLIHSGSRGFGHQICQDTLNRFVKLPEALKLPDKQLACAPIQSDLGQTYLRAMAAAANYAFNNRQQILHLVRKSFQKVLNIAPNSIRLVYDVCHNIAKFETHSNRRLCVHRKGATRAFGPGHPELSPLFQETGQPVLVPGDMGRASHILVGRGNPLTFSTSCHGAGRVHSRHQCLKTWQGRDPIDHMKKQGVTVMARSSRTIAEEMPDAYKDVDLVVEAVQEAGLADRVAKLKPFLVIKG